MISAIIHGQIASEPVSRTASNGKPYWTTTVRVNAGVETIYVGVATYDATAGELLATLHEHLPIAAVGTLEATVWQAQDGEERRGWRLTAREILILERARKRGHSRWTR